MFEKKNISNICRVRRFYRRAYIEKHSPILNLKKMAVSICILFNKRTNLPNTVSFHLILYMLDYNLL